MSIIKFTVTFFILLSACVGTSQTDRNPNAEATYRVLFLPNWTQQSFPTNFPVGSDHFSGLIGATHNRQINFWSPGRAATPGIESVAETGSKILFIDEVTKQKQNKTAEFLLSGSGLSTGKGQVVLEFDINQSHSLVTLISMIAPSPDWFVGVHDLNLFINGQWTQSLRINLPVYDSGTDLGSVFTSFNFNSHGLISRLSSLSIDTDFFNGFHRGNQQAIAQFLFEKIK